MRVSGKLAWAFVAAVLVAVPAWAQRTTVRVTVERATIWRENLVTVATVVNQGAVLEVTGRRGAWLQVVLPLSEGTPRRTGFIAVSQVERVSGTLPAEGTATLPDRSTSGPRTGSGIRRAARRAAPPRSTGVRAFGDVSYSWFTAHDTFKAIIGQPGSPFVGGGAEFRLQDRLFVQGSARWLRRTGERVVVSEDEVFSTGLSDTLTIVPLAVTVGYRWYGPSAIPYVGGGLGQYRLKETSDFSGPTEKIERQIRSYHVLAGVEWRGTRTVGGAVEVQYTHVPDALNGEVADAFDEHNLGGIEARVKILFGK